MRDLLHHIELYSQALFQFISDRPTGQPEGECWSYDRKGSLRDVSLQEGRLVCIDLDNGFEPVPVN